jgi:putative methyltransferase (TIGR04325 family)
MKYFETDEFIGKQKNLPNNYDCNLLFDICQKVGENQISILDFGGGLGKPYRTLKQTFSLKYSIIGLPRMCEAGNEMFKQDNNISFYKDFPDSQDVDIVYIRSAIQYSEKWDDTIVRLLMYKPLFFILEFVPVSDSNKTCKLKQQGMDYWSINYSALKSLFMNIYKNIYVMNNKDVMIDGQNIKTLDLVFKKL